MDDNKDTVKFFMQKYPVEQSFNGLVVEKHKEKGNEIIAAINKLVTDRGATNSYFGY